MQRPLGTRVESTQGLSGHYFKKSVNNACERFDSMSPRVYYGHLEERLTLGLSRSLRWQWKRKKRQVLRSISIPRSSPTAMNESEATAATDDQELVATASALNLEEKDLGPQQKSRAPFGSR